MSDVYRDVTLTVKDGDEVLYSAKKIKMAPGEMENVKLKKELLAGRGGHTLTVSLEEKGGEAK